MSHSNTQRLTDYWHRQRGAGLAPLRASVDPTDFADLLPQVFILGRQAAGRYSFRLSGGLLKDLHGRELRQADFIDLWGEADRIGLQAGMEAALRHGRAMVIDAAGATEEGQDARFEILLAPMISASGQADRFLGLYQPVSPLQRLRGEALASLSVMQLRPVAQSLPQNLAPLSPGWVEAPRPFPLLRLAAVDGRRTA